MDEQQFVIIIIELIFAISKDDSISFIAHKILWTNLRIFHHPFKTNSVFPPPPSPFVLMGAASYKL